MRSHAGHNGDNGMGAAAPHAATCAPSHTHTRQQVRGASMKRVERARPNWTRGNERLSRLDAGFIFYYVAQTSAPLLALGGAPAQGLRKRRLIKICPAAAPCPGASVADLWLPFGAL